MAKRRCCIRSLLVALGVSTVAFPFLSLMLVQKSKMALVESVQPASAIAESSRLHVQRLENFDETTSPPFVIYYHVYIPFGEERDEHGERRTAKRARRIFREQIGRVGRSYANSLPHKVTVFFNTIGDGQALNASYVHDVCTVHNNVTCHRMHHYDAGYEDVTLQALYEFCHAHPQHQVVYMHSKGSFRKRRYQNVNRRVMTAAVTSEECLKATRATTDDSSSCNLCGHWFIPTWGPYMAGNFFTAQCSYIQKLVPPHQINDTMTNHVQRDFLAMHQKGLLLANLLTDTGPYAMGTGRYSHEHWVAGHPSVRPCDVLGAQQQQQQEPTTNDDTQTLFSRMAAPRDPLQSTKWYGIKAKLVAKVLKRKDWRMREYFLLPGYLFRMYALYGEAPPPSSWIWSWFPDGPEWKRAVDQDGARAVEVVTSQYIPKDKKR